MPPILADVKNLLQGVCIYATLHTVFSHGTGSRSTGLGSVLNCVCLNYYGVPIAEIYGIPTLTTTYRVTLPVLDTAQPQGVCTYVCKL